MLEAAYTSNYQFKLTASAGGMLYINGVLAIDDSGNTLCLKSNP